MHLTIDRFENEYAVCETDDDTMIQLPLTQLPEGCREGTVLCYTENQLIIDSEEEEKRRERIRAKRKQIFR